MNRTMQSQRSVDFDFWRVQVGFRTMGGPLSPIRGDSKDFESRRMILVFVFLEIEGLVSRKDKFEIDLEILLLQ